MQSLLDNLEIKTKELIDFFINLGYYSNIYEFMPEEVLTENITKLHEILRDINFLKEEYSKFSDYMVHV
jgi:hypothetical protein